MGVTQSKKDVIEKPFSESCLHSTYGNFLENKVAESFVQNPISEDLLIEFLSYVPVEDLVFNCRLVCKQWRDIIDAQSVWRSKCENEHIKLPKRKLVPLPKHHYRYLYCYAKSGTKNLLKNPCGENQLSNWHTTSNFSVENPPAGADPVPAVVGSQSCFATTYTKCEKFQIVSLGKNPIFSYLLHHDLVKIEVGEWYAARFDCASEYRLRVVLYDHQYDIIDQFEFKYEEEQWTGKEWHLVTHEFHNVSNVGFIGFFHEGQDRQFWAGHYGSKMTGAFVQLCLK